MSFDSAIDSLVCRPLIEDGKIELAVRSGQLSLVLLVGNAAKGSQLTYINPAEGNTITWRGTGNGYFLKISHSVLMTLPGLYAVAVYFRNYQPPLPVDIAASNIDEEVKMLFSLINFQQIIRSEESGALMASACTTLLLRTRQLARQMLPFDGLSQPYRLTARFTELVEQNFVQHSGVNFYAQELAITEDHLSRICQRELGARAKDFIQARQFHEAKRLLRSTSARVKEIAADVGFENTNYFSRAFKQYCGIGPQGYRKQRL